MSEGRSWHPAHDVEELALSELATVQVNFKLLGAGGGFNFSCSYTNKSGSPVGSSGESANDEMRSFPAHSLPEQGGEGVRTTDNRRQRGRRVAARSRGIT
jgi:hypothetical protein